MACADGPLGTVIHVSLFSADPQMRSPNQKLAALFLLGVVLFNYPILSLFNKATSALGIPVVYVYIFLAWAGVIGAVAWIVERSR